VEPFNSQHEAHISSLLANNLGKELFKSQFANYCQWIDGLAQEFNQSTIKATNLRSSTVTQDTMDVHCSYVGNFGKKTTNLVNKVNAYNSDIIQDSLIAENAIVTGTQVSIQNNTVSRSNLYSSHIDQANIIVTDSDVNRLTVCQTNLVCDSKLCNANLSQGKVDISL